MKKYHQLSKCERYIISQKIQAGMSIKMISEHLNVDFSTIYREIKRNSDENGIYDPYLADEKASKRHKHRLKFWQKNEVLRDEIVSYLKRNCPHFSPENLEHYLKLIGKKSPCFKTIYNMIWACKKENISDVYKFLHHRGRRYQPRNRTAARVKNIKNRRDIDERPKSIEKRDVFGDWEADLMYFQGRAILTLVERKSRFAITSHLVNTRAQTINDEITRIITQSGMCYGKVSKRLKFSSLTFDNGSEFAHVFELEKTFNLKTYFAKPASPYQRGSNENFNGLLRYYLPRKASPFTHEFSLQDATEQINNRPRKIHKWRSALDILMRC